MNIESDALSFFDLCHKRKGGKDENKIAENCYKTNFLCMRMLEGGVIVRNRVKNIRIRSL